MSITAYPRLFSPLRLASHTLKNRVVFSSVFTGLARDGKVTPELQNFHTARAQGGVAAIVAEPFAMWRGPTAPVLVRVHGRNNNLLDDLRRLAENIGRHDCHLIGQLQDPGTAVIYDFDGTDFVYASAVLLADRFERVVLLTPAEVVARDDSLVTRQSAHKRSFEAGVEIITWSELGAQPKLEEGIVSFQNLMWRC